MAESVGIECKRK